MTYSIHRNTPRYHGSSVLFVTRKKWLRIDDKETNLAHPVDDAFAGARHRLVSVRQEFGQNREVLHRVVRTSRVGVNIDNVGWRMPGKILLEATPRAGQDPAASIQTRDRSSENITSQREGCDVAAGRTSVSVQINVLPLAPDKNPIGRVGMR